MLPTYAGRLKEARTKANLTQVQVKSHTGINNKTLSGYENGIAQPDYETLNKLCTLYGVTIDWVLGNTNNPNSALNDTERALVKAIELGDDSFLDAEFTINGRELTRADKEKLQAMARLLLLQDR
ncbi:helix-turn-helix domain-containing protein [Paenibacillus polymyxa]|uniref:helix-turn-helix domain-containing protein n=1 Tax=Paenibacillus polymyxa TaxID=1406 RepID=UPI003D2BF9D3